MDKEKYLKEFEKFRDTYHGGEGKKFLSICSKEDYLEFLDEWNEFYKALEEDEKMWLEYFPSTKRKEK